MFARRFIDDDKDKARQLKPAAREEFRSIVYGYMSRVRRGDAKLAFPDRVVQMHKVLPTSAELDLIRTVAEPIQTMNRLAQISILQALVSSPDALSAQLGNMARKGTVPPELSAAVSAIVKRMPPSAKLTGLGVLIDQLKRQNPNSWRLVVFTTRRETQTTIVNFLENQGLTVGIINGESGDRNQDTITRFRQSPPGYRVIVSTEAGSEGVNLQVANVLVNYDLPWNPMIVEQRVGRVQRLGSEHAHVSIFNITLQGTFEEYIVARLMEKLQMATHAIGDIESLLQGSDIRDGDDDAAESFEDLILNLVVAALAGKNVAEDVRLKEISIENAKRELEREEANINAILGGRDGAAYVGPRPPTLPPVVRSMDVPEFTVAAYRMLGAKVSEPASGIFMAEERDGREYIVFEESRRAERKFSLYAPQTPAFQRLVKRAVTSGMHDVRDVDTDAVGIAKSLAREWVGHFGARLTNAGVVGSARAFEGDALLRVRATTAHDSYERLVECPCRPSEHVRAFNGEQGLAPVEKLIRDAGALGIDPEKLQAAGESDDAIAEFSRFYLERGAIEMQAAGTDERKRTKLEDDFTPRLDTALVGLNGSVRRDVKLRAEYSFPSGGSYVSELTIRPSIECFIDPPAMDRCSQTGAEVPVSCLGRCDVSQARALKHLLVQSEVSGRAALPEHTARCAFSGKTALTDELTESDVTGGQIATALLKRSAVSGQRAEPDLFGRCAFSDAEALKTELAVSGISGKAYRADEQARSDVSGKTGHRQEFMACAETGQMMAKAESETCAVTSKRVRPGVLVTCEVTGKRAVPDLFGVCAGTRKRVLKELLVPSSVSNAAVLRQEAVQSTIGTFCLSSEVETCFWSGRTAHPDDIRTCSLTGLSIHAAFATARNPARLQPLVELLDGVRRTADQNQLWPQIAARMTVALKGGKCRVEAAVSSPAKRHLAICSESKTLLGLRVHQVGAIYDLTEDAIVGKLAEGKRHADGWLAR